MILNTKYSDFIETPLEVRMTVVMKHGHLHLLEMKFFFKKNRQKILSSSGSYNH